jgi:hypothetical protein
MPFSEEDRARCPQQTKGLGGRCLAVDVSGRASFGRTFVVAILSRHWRIAAAPTVTETGSEKSADVRRFNSGRSAAASIGTRTVS